VDAVVDSSCPVWELGPVWWTMAAFRFPKAAALARVPRWEAGLGVRPVDC
jgi:hypothetical protein